MIINLRASCMLVATLKVICETLRTATTSSTKIGKLNINVKSNFQSQKSLCDILFSIANTRLKENATG